MLTEAEYKRLVDERDKLVEMQQTKLIPKHRMMVEEQLTNIRQQLKDAHYERYHKTGQS